MQKARRDCYFTGMQSDGCAWEQSLSGSLVIWGKDCRGELGQVSGAFCSIRAGFFSQVCVPTEAWAGQASERKDRERSCNALHTALRTFSGTWAWGPLGTLQKHGLWETAVVCSFMWFSPITFQVQNQWKKALKLLNSPDYHVIVLCKLPTKLNFQQKTTPFSTQNKKTLSC